MFELLGEQEIDWDRTDVFQVDERIAPDGDPDRNLTHMLEHLPSAAVERLQADAGHRRGPRGRRRSLRETRFPSVSTSSTSASAPTAIRPRSCPATRSSRSPTAASH